MSKDSFDRRAFLKGAAATAAAVIGTQVAATNSPAQGAESNSEPKDGAQSRDKIIGRPGSDYMVDVIKATGMEYIASNPGSSFRSLQESIVNYGGNKKPEFLTCTHEEISVAMAHGYAKVAGKPMGIAAHGTVGLQHATMAVYNAWCDRVPVMMFAGNFLDAAKRRPGTEWYHCVQDAAALVRDFTKWDDQPLSLQHFAESVHARLQDCHHAAHGPRADHRRRRLGGRTNLRGEETEQFPNSRFRFRPRATAAQFQRRPRCWRRRKIQ